MILENTDEGVIKYCLTPRKKRLICGDEGSIKRLGEDICGLNGYSSPPRESPKPNPRFNQKYSLSLN